jgi:hypothetical protein
MIRPRPVTVGFTPLLATAKGIPFAFEIQGLGFHF